MKRGKIEVYSYKGKTARWLKILLALILAGVLTFTACLVCVLFGGRTQISGQPEVMVILGCQVKPWGPSILLQDRLDTALDYLEEYPELTVVVSGGRGPDEHISEAQCMYDYLVEHGISEEQIIREEYSHNTLQNLRYTIRHLEQAGFDAARDDIVVVSNGFHLTRVRMLWERVAGSQDDLSTLAAPSSHVPSRLKMYVREPLALVKSFIFDR